MPPTKSTAGKLDDGRSSAGREQGTVLFGMKGRMGSGQKVTGMKGSGMKVTGMKGRMGGRMGGTSSPTKGIMQQMLPFKTVKKPPQKRKSKKKLTTDMILSGNKKQDDALLKLRIPLTICTSLPSVKKFKTKAGRKKSEKMIFEAYECPNNGSNYESHPVFSQKKRRTDMPRYEISHLTEHRFPGMIWDLAFTPDGDIVVTGSEGAILCDAKLKVKAKFENIFLPGAVSFLTDGRIVIVDRSSDTVNFYRRSATFIRSFNAGNCPMGMVVTSKDEVVVSDTGDKCVRKYDLKGKLLMTIPTQGEQYALRWPLYLTRFSNDDIVVSDVHQQKVLRFSTTGEFQDCLSLKTHSGSSVLRPHGVCVTKTDELMVVDTSIESLELFLREGTYMQTLLMPEAGSALEPKLCKLSPDNSLLGVGGMSGIIRLFQVNTRLKEEVARPSVKHERRSSIASSSSSTCDEQTLPSSVNNNKVKVEPKAESMETQ